MRQAVIAVQNDAMNEQRPKCETMSLEEATYDKIKEQIVAKQK
jgi:hypothetical protein